MSKGKRGEEENEEDGGCMSSYARARRGSIAKLSNKMASNIVLELREGGICGKGTSVLEKSRKGQVRQDRHPQLPRDAPRPT